MLSILYFYYQSGALHSPVKLPKIPKKSPTKASIKAEPTSPVSSINSIRI